VALMPKPLRRGRAAGPVSGVCSDAACWVSVRRPGQQPSGRGSGVTRERCGRATLESDSLRVSSSPVGSNDRFGGRRSRLGFAGLMGFGPEVV
jgi:hypothetical protein